MNVFLATLGCRLNEAELAGWERHFAAAGHAVVPGPAAAQVMVVNTCAVTAEAARKSRKLVSGLHRRNPNAKLVLTGCWAALEPERAAALAGVDLVLENAAKDELVERVSRELDVGSMPVLATEPESAHVYREARTRAFLKVQDGCRNRCTFCIVTVARGEERSRPLDDLVNEVQELTLAGHREVVLTGVHLGGYGSDLGLSLRRLVEEILERTDVERLRLSSLEPWDLPEGFAELWRDPRLMPHLHLPLQSGSDRVLKKMARRCRAEEFERLVDGFRQAIPALTVTTDLIVGFPGETEADHHASLALSERVGFGHVHVFPYSPREGTHAARLPDQVPGEIKRRRSRELRDLAAKLKAAHLSRFVGDEREVLWEGAGEPLEGEPGRRHTGYTDNYLRVEATAAESHSVENRVTSAALIASTGTHLIARLR